MLAHLCVRRAVSHNSGLVGRFGVLAAQTRLGHQGNCESRLFIVGTAEAAETVLVAGKVTQRLESEEDVPAVETWLRIKVEHFC